MNQQWARPTEFLAEQDISRELASALMKLAPANPFCTASYAEAIGAPGQPPWLLGTSRKGQLITGCYGYLFSGHLNRGLQIPSLPDVPSDDDFWTGLLRFCSSHRLTSLELQSFASKATHIPPLPGEVMRQERCEYVLDLEDPEWDRKIHKKHRYGIRKALQARVTMRKGMGASACREHARLLAATAERLRKRGVFISRDAEEQWAWSLLLEEKGAGELFQAVAGEKVLSSVMVLRAAEGAYMETAGTSAEGMICGASHFLIYSVARALREEAIREFNLGGAESNPGLSLFKSRFGATPVPLQSASFCLGSWVRRKLTHAARSLRQIASASLRGIRG